MGKANCWPADAAIRGRVMYCVRTGRWSKLSGLADKGNRIVLGVDWSIGGEWYASTLS